MKPSVVRQALCATLSALCASVVLAQAQAPASAPAASSATAPGAAASAPAAPAVTAVTAGASESGKLAWYGRKFTGRKTASGEAYNPSALTMAHKTLPFGTLVKVTNTKNGKSATLRVNDRGPTQGDRVGDVSQAAARKLGMTRSGVIDAELAVVGSAAAKNKR